jgi:hypothetical protein
MIQTVGPAATFVSLVIGELVIILFIGDWNLVIGHSSFPSIAAERQHVLNR